MSFVQRCNYFQCLKLADWQLIITHIQSFIKGWVETEHLWGSGNDPRLVIIIPQLQWVMCAIRLWCYCARAAALAAAGGVFPGEASNTAERPLCPRRQTRRWQLKGAKLCAAASSENTTTEVRKGHRRQFRQSCSVSMAMALWRAALVLPVRLGSNEIFFTHRSHPWIRMKL